MSKVLRYLGKMVFVGTYVQNYVHAQRLNKFLLKTYAAIDRFCMITYMAVAAMFYGPCCFPMGSAKFDHSKTRIMCRVRKGKKLCKKRLKSTNHMSFAYVYYSGTVS